MATFRNRNGKWQVRVRRKGQPAVVKSFQTKQDGERWARQVESDIDKGAYTNLALAERTTLKELIERYLAEVTALSRSAGRERRHLSFKCTQPRPTGSVERHRAHAEPSRKVSRQTP